MGDLSCDQCGKPTTGGRLCADCASLQLTPAQARQAARAMEFAETLNKRPDLYVFGKEFQEARLLLEQCAGGDETD